MADLKLTIGTQSRTLNADTPVALLLENTGGEHLSFRLLARLELSGSLEGWSFADVRTHDARTPLSDRTEVALAPGQNLYSRVRLGGLLFSSGQGSAAPSLSWDDFVVGASPINSDIQLQAICEYDSVSDHGQIKSNVLGLQLLGMGSEDSLLRIRQDVRNVALALQSLMSVVDDLRRSPPKKP